MRERIHVVLSILLMVPEIPLLILEGVLAVAGINLSLTSFGITLSLRGLGLAMLVGLTNRNRSRGTTTGTADRSAAIAGEV